MSVGFISEMAALPILGGGVTLTRILGEDINKISWFAKTIHYQNEIIPEYAFGNSYVVPFWTVPGKLRWITGCRLAWWLASNRLSRRIYALRLVGMVVRNRSQLKGSRALVCPNSTVTLFVVDKIFRELSLEYVTWVMDDHMVQWINGSWYYPPEVELMMKNHLERARMVFVISPAMQEFYKHRFGVDSTVLCSPAEADVVDRSSRSVGPRLRLAYFGSLGRWQNDAIEPLAEFLKSGEISLDVFSHNLEQLPVNLAESGALSRGSIPPGEVISYARNYDAIVLPVSFKDELRNMTSLNIATKFSECLATSVPTLLIGPNHAAMVRMARSAGACVIVDELRSECFESAISDLRDAQFRRKVVEAEWHLLDLELSPEIMRQRWLPAAEILFRDNSLPKSGGETFNGI